MKSKQTRGKIKKNKFAMEKQGESQRENGETNNIHEFLVVKSHSL